MKKYTFYRGGWNSDEFIYAASSHFSYRKPFIQEDDCILGKYNNEVDNWDYISMVTKESYGSGTVIETTCEFEDKGAPLIVLTNELETLENGNIQYGAHFEVVLYWGGCNIWYLPLIDGRAKSQNLLNMKTPLAEKKPIKLRVEIVGKVFKVNFDGQEFDLFCEHLPEKFHVGLTSCEGVCKFYDLTIE